MRPRIEGTYSRMLDGIRNLKPPKTYGILSFRSREKTSRLRIYSISRLTPPVYKYSSNISGGQEHFTKNKVGPDGEETHPSPYHWVVMSQEEGGFESYIGHFRTWGWFLHYLKLMWAIDIELMSE